MQIPLLPLPLFYVMFGFRLDPSFYSKKGLLLAPFLQDIVHVELPPEGLDHEALNVIRMP